MVGFYLSEYVMILEEHCHSKFYNFSSMMTPCSGRKGSKDAISL